MIIFILVAVLANNPNYNKAALWAEHFYLIVLINEIAVIIITLCKAITAHHFSCPSYEATHMTI